MHRHCICTSLIPLYAPPRLLHALRGPKGWRHPLGNTGTMQVPPTGRCLVHPAPPIRPRPTFLHSGYSILPMWLADLPAT